MSFTKGREPYASLCSLETIFLIGSWSFGVGYSLYHLALASNRYTYKLSLTDLEPGWIFGRLVDTSDSEWTVFSEVLLSSIPWLFIHFLGTQILKKRAQTSLLCLFSLLLSLGYLFKCLGTQGTLYLLVQPLSFFALSLVCRRPLLFWGLGIWFISGFQWVWPSRILADHLLSSMPQVSHYIMNVTMCWINARCISYALDVSWGDAPRKEGSPWEELLNFLSYCFYFPLCIGGPIIIYKNFLEGISGPYVAWNPERIRDFIFQILRYSFWLFVAHVAMHFFYFSAIQFEPGIMEALDLWSIAGLGYGMGQFFHLKYVVFYGFPRPFVLADGVDIPNHPQCIGRIHLYSNMWRNFDHGLYLFLQRYIYRPLLGSRRDLFSKLLASAISFGFIYVWHGVMEHVLMWSALNFIGITIESLAKSICRTEAYQCLESRWLSPRMERRMHALLSSPLFLVSIISNFYFFMGKNNGDLYFSRIISSWPRGTLSTLFFMYSGAQTSLEVSNWEHRKKKRLEEGRHHQHN
eukprot:TRINITY_DN4261_c0_g1_i2.p1 TRINITY_DN4261_c0_g1~~TRINITY_DN4261_c0_g1_i2.p1  ORF type:complete len:521 (-),score=57.10 TRINITY_DN4261_c0_g1_i2:452-2014(-)